MTRQPVAILGGIEELRQRVAAGHHDFAILLGGGVISRKTIRCAHLSTGDEWRVTNHIDGSRQRLSAADLWTESHIGEALDKGALLDMKADEGLILVAGKGWRKGSEWLAEVQAAAPAPEPQTDPLRYTINGGPGALRMGTPDPEDAEWEPADPVLDLHVMDIGPATVAEIDLSARGFDGKAADTSIELTIGEIDGLIATLTALREDAIANRGFALDERGIWMNKERE